MNFGIAKARRHLVMGVILLMATVPLMTGCATDSAAAKAQDAKDVDKAMEKLGYELTAAQKSDGFKDAGNGVAVRWANTAEKAESKCPSYGESCYTVAIQTNVACSEGIYIELQLKNASGTVIGKANEITPGMRANDKGVFPIATSVKAPKAAMADVHCMG
jgi:hypothetical protein